MIFILKVIAGSVNFVAIFVNWKEKGVNEFKSGFKM